LGLPNKAELLKLTNFPLIYINRKVCTQPVTPTLILEKASRPKPKTV